MIYCVWYPSGGFGNFVNSVLNSYGHNFVRPTKAPTFSKNGNSHSQELVAPTYSKDPSEYHYDFRQDVNYSVLVDNGINNEGARFKTFFPNANVIKICYSDRSWPIVAHTMIVKAKTSTIDKDLLSDLSGWDCNEPWVQREKFFLFLRDSSLRWAWKPSDFGTGLFVDDLLDYQTFRQKLGVPSDDFKSHWDLWREANDVYIRPILDAESFLNGSLNQITDIWTQAVVYYQIWCKHGIEVPHNDFSNFFIDSAHCQDWIGTVT